MNISEWDIFLKKESQWEDRDIQSIWLISWMCCGVEWLFRRVEDRAIRCWSRRRRKRCPDWSPRASRWYAGRRIRWSSSVQSRWVTTTSGWNRDSFRKDPPILVANCRRMARHRKRPCRWMESSSVAGSAVDTLQKSIKKYFNFFKN